MTVPWRGQAFVAPGWALFTGSAGDHAAHAHHAVQVTLGLEARFSLWTPQTAWRSHRGVVIRAGQRHRLGVDPAPIVSFYADAQADLGRALSRLAPEGLAVLDRRTVLGFLRVLTSSEPPAARREALARLLRERDAPNAAAPDPIVEAIVRFARAAPLVPSGPELAAHAGLSLSRLGHRFRAAAGIPLRPYLRWLRLERAAALALAGHDLTRAAHDAGFADAAHLTRTFVRHFGVSPSQALKHLEAAPRGAL